MVENEKAKRETERETYQRHKKGIRETWKMISSKYFHTCYV
jgi:hypothetical protein